MLAVIVAVAAVLAIFRTLSVSLDRRLEALDSNTRRFETGEPVGPPDPGDDEIADLDARFRFTYELLADRETAAARYRFLSEQHLASTQFLGADNGASVELRKTVGRRDSDLRLRAALLEANEASRLKSEFVATMSHEIRTPMNAILGMTELLLDSSLDSRQRALAAAAYASGQALLRIIDDILDFSKIEAGKLDFETRPFDLAKTIESVAELFAPQAQRKGLGLTWSVSSGTPLLVMGDELRVRQVLTNLTGNALKFTAVGSVAVVCSVNNRSESSLAARLEVTDTGIGLDQATTERLFTAFTQGDGSITRRYGGTGLGLAICKKLVTSMGGTIGVASRPAVGSTFWFELPFEIPMGAGPNATSPIAAPRAFDFDDQLALPEAGDWNARPLGRVLLVEDNPVNQHVGREQLETIGYSVACAENGRAAIDAVEHERFDIVFMDLQLPDMDGFATTQTIRSHERSTGSHVPIVALTAEARDTDRAACLAAGMDDYLSKPVALRELRTVLARWIPARSANET